MQPDAQAVVVYKVEFHDAGVGTGRVFRIKLGELLALCIVDRDLTP